MSKQNQEMTGYPSIDRPWMKYYKEGAYEQANNIPLNKTVWDVIEEKLIEYDDVPAMEYFGRKISRKEFRESVYTWAKAFRAMGVKEDEIVAVYGPFLPDICAITYGLNVIGATPYFLKPAISEDALLEETAEVKIAVVFEDMWDHVKSVFQNERFQRVIIVSALDYMPVPQKERRPLFDCIDIGEGQAEADCLKKYIWAEDARKLAASYMGSLKADFVPNRNAFITSSSGTTADGVVKGVIATNESALAQLRQAQASEMHYVFGKKCLTNFPPAASTGLNCLFNLPLFNGMILIIDPRVEEEIFYQQVLNYQLSMIISTGNMWETFFRRIERELKEGKRYDFSCADMWAIGGEGTNPRYLKKWNEIMKKCKAPNPLFIGYGSSEVFSVSSVDSVNAFSNEKNTRPVIGVGIPFAGVEMGIFSSDGKELPYNTRGEMWEKSKSIMKGYYGKPELTAQTVVDGWVHTGDLAEIDEDGFLYIWGRIKDKATLENGREVYLFDIANEIRKHPAIDDAVVNEETLPSGQKILTAYIVWNKEIKEEEKEACLDEMDRQIETNLPGVVIGGYLEHENTLPYSKTTLKKDRKGMIKNISGYRRVRSRELEEFLKQQCHI